MTHDDETVERVADAIRLSQARDDEGRFAPLGDLLGFSGENATRIVCREAARAAISALPERELLREALLREALSALDQIVDFHIGDCPMTMEEIDFAKNINWEIRKTARAAADKIRAALGGEKP